VINELFVKYIAILQKKLEDFSNVLKKIDTFLEKSLFMVLQHHSPKSHDFDESQFFRKNVFFQKSQKSGTISIRCTFVTDLGVLLFFEVAKNMRIFCTLFSCFFSKWDNKSVFFGSKKPPKNVLSFTFFFPLKVCWLIQDLAMNYPILRTKFGQKCCTKKMLNAESKRKFLLTKQYKKSFFATVSLVLFFPIIYILFFKNLHF
jgi:hypothetical protein